MLVTLKLAFPRSNKKRRMCVCVCVCVTHRESETKKRKSKKMQGLLQLKLGSHIL